MGAADLPRRLVSDSLLRAGRTPRQEEPELAVPFGSDGNALLLASFSLSKNVKTLRSWPNRMIGKKNLMNLLQGK